MDLFIPTTQLGVNYHVLDREKYLQIRCLRLFLVACILSVDITGTISVFLFSWGKKGLVYKTTKSDQNDPFSQL